MIKMLSKNNPVERDQLEMIALRPACAKQSFSAQDGSSA